MTWNIQNETLKSGIFVSTAKFCQFIHTAAQWPSSLCLPLSLQQMDCEGLNLLNLPLFPLCWLPPRYQIYTPIHNAAPSQFAPSASKSSTGEQSDTVPQSAILRLLWCHTEPPGSSRRAYVPVALSPAPLVPRRGGWQELALAWLWQWPLCVLYNLSLPLWRHCSKSVFVGSCAGRRTHRKTQAKHTLSVFPSATMEGFLSVRATAVRQVVPQCMCLFADSCRERQLPKDHSVRTESNRKLNIQKNRCTDQLRGLADWMTRVLKRRDSECTPNPFDCKHDPAQPHRALFEILSMLANRGTYTLLLPSAAARNISMAKIILKIMCPWFWVSAILMSRIQKSKDNFFGNRKRS